MVWDHISSHDLISVGLAMICIVALHVFLHKKRNGNEHLFLRSILLLLGLIGLGLLYVNPKISELSPSTNIILQTDAAIENENEVSNIHEILNSEHAYDTIIIRGNGLSQDALTMLDSFHLKFEPREKLKGFQEINIPTIKEKQIWNLSGKVIPNEIENVSLQQSNGKSLETIPDETGNFSFQPTSNSRGHFTYAITANYADTTITETIPIKVLPSRKWNLLAYSSAPSFELNYLKNYWVKLGNGFSLRQQVSNDRYKETFLNNPKISLDKINSETLRKFNFLLMDALSWNLLKADQQKLALNYVASGRVGLLFFGLEKGDQLDQIKNSQVINIEEITLPSYNIKLDQLTLNSSARNLKFNSANTALIKRYGLGSIGISTINNTYRFILANQNTEYQNIWANIFSELYIEPSENIVMKSSKWLWEGEDATIDIFSTKELEDRAILNDNQELEIEKTTDLEGLYTAKHKADSGWNTIELKKTKRSHRFFVHADDSWQAMRQSHLHKINTQAANQQRQIREKENINLKPLPFYWGILINLIGFGGLWFHERIYA